MRNSLLVAALSLTAAALVGAAELPPPRGEGIVDPRAKIEHLFTRTAPIQGGLTEGPTVAPDGSIYFSDISVGTDKGQILRFDPKTRKTTVFAADSYKSNGLFFDSEGRLVACEGADYGGRCLSRWDVKTGKREVLVDRYQGKRFNAPNDLCIDRRGRIYFADPKYLGPEERELEHRAIYRFDPKSRQIVEITHNCEKPNGVALSPDDRTLYVVEHNNGTDRIDPNAPPPKAGAMRIYSFPLGTDGLINGPRRTLIDFGEEKSCDGMALDVKGNVYLALRSLRRPGILVIEPNGKEVGFIPTGPSQPDAKEPVGLPSNVEFGIGQESRMLYITIDKGLYRIPVKVEGYHIPYPSR